MPETIKLYRKKSTQMLDTNLNILTYLQLNLKNKRNANAL